LVAREPRDLLAQRYKVPLKSSKEKIKKCDHALLARSFALTHDIAVARISDEMSDVPLLSSSRRLPQAIADRPAELVRIATVLAGVVNDLLLWYIFDI
jgi:hypothetical protein